MTVSEKTVRKQIAAVAAEMVQKTVELLDGCRTIVQLRGSLAESDISDPDLLVLVGVIRFVGSTRFIAWGECL